MNLMKFTAFVSLFVLFSVNTFAKPVIIYTDPEPDAKYVSIDNEIIIGFDSPVNLNLSNSADFITVIGNKSGIHTGEIKLVENNSKILFKPSVPFTFGENVHVIVNEGSKTINGAFLNKYSFSFTTQKNKIAWNPTRSFREELDIRASQKNYGIAPPPGLPQISVITDNNPTPGKIFMSNFPFDTNISNIPFLIITDNAGVPFYYKELGAYSFDFKEQPNGFLTYFDATAGNFKEMDTNYNIIESFYCGNGYTADPHELRVLNDGSAYLLSYDPEIVNMSEIVAGGDTAATVVGLVVQKIDQNKNVVFQWRSWNHYRIADAIHQNLLAPYIDYVHGNAIEIDNDGNFIISARHQDEISKINVSNGEFIWRLGGGVNNQFTFLNDPDGFNYQHAIRRLANGDLILFDNGNFHTPPYSRAVEYSLDLANKTVSKVWQYRHTPDVQSQAMGFAQRLDDGNTLISWGAANPTLTEVTPQGATVLELSLPSGVYSYRTFKFNWNYQPIGITPISSIVPKSYSLSQNYPNPFNPSTIIKFDIIKTGHVSLVVYNELGQEVSMVVDETLTPGSYSAAFNGASLSSGVYFYRLVTDNFTSVKKMALIK